MLDLEGFVGGSSSGPDEGFGGSSSKAGASSRGGTSSKGGSSSRGGTGSAGTPTGIAGKTSTSPASPTSKACAQYCAGYSVTCAQELEDDNCEALCEDEIDNSDARCQKLGVEAVTCLTPFFRAGSGSCEAATNRGLVKCGATLAKFKTCSGGSDPTPPGPAPGEPFSCPNMRSVSSFDCQETFACPSTLYEASCFDDPGAGVLHCSCTRGSQGAKFDMTRVPLQGACRQALQFCP